MSLAPSMTPSPGYADTAEELRPNGAAIRKADIKTTVFVGNIDTTSCSRLNALQAEPLPDTLALCKLHAIQQRVSHGIRSHLRICL